MSDHDHPEEQMPKPPTAKQQRYLRVLAQRTRTTFTSPRTSAEDSAEIKRLERLGARQPRRGSGRRPPFSSRHEELLRGGCRAQVSEHAVPRHAARVAAGQPPLSSATARTSRSVTLASTRRPTKAGSSEESQVSKRRDREFGA